MATYTGKIYSKSPYFIVETGSADFTSTAYIYVWTGSFDTDRPLAPEFTMSKSPAAVSGTQLYYEISQLIRSKFSHSPYSYAAFFTSGSQKDAVWVGIETTGSAAEKDNYYLAMDGYTDFLRGVNYFNETVVPMSNTTIYVPEGKRFGIPVFCNPDAAARVSFLDATGSALYDPSLAGNTTGSLSYDKLRYISYNDTGSLVQSIKVFGVTDNLLKTIYVKRTDCTVNYNNKCVFLNKHGVMQEIWFVAASNKTLNVTKSSYNKYLTYITGGVPTYELNHQYKDINVQGTEIVSLNTGWVDEGFNVVIKELLLSDHVWITHNSDEYLPANVSSSSIQYKTNLQSNLINYTIEFKVAFDQINSVL